MGKAGMSKYVKDHQDPTYDQALGNIRKESRQRLAWLEKQVQQKAKEAGYNLEALIVKDNKTGAISKIG